MFKVSSLEQKGKLVKHQMIITVGAYTFLFQFQSVFVTFHVFFERDGFLCAAEVRAIKARRDWNKFKLPENRKMWRNVFLML